MDEELRLTCDTGVLFSEATTSRDTLLISNVTLLGRVSRNGRRYSDQAMREAAELMNGVPFMFDHPEKSDLRDGGARSVLDIAGKIRGARVVDDQVRGDIELLNVRESADFVCALAEQMPEMAGLSQRALGTVKHTTEGDDVVESISRVFAVELVADPATTHGIFESIEAAASDSTEKEDIMDWTKLTLGEIVANRPELLEQFLASQGHAARIGELEAENAELKSRLDASDVAEVLRNHEVLVATRLAEAKLPDVAVTDLFREQLTGAADGDAIDKLIEDRWGVIRTVVGSGRAPSSSEREIEGGATEHAVVSLGDVAEAMGSMFN